jgi:transposase
MARSRPLLSQAQWKKIAPLLPKPRKHRKGGRPWIDNRRVLEGILWILRSDARWQDLPEKYPHPSTCWRPLRDWEEQGIWLNHLARLLERIERARRTGLERIVSGRQFCSGEKRGAGVGKTKRARARSGWWWSTARVFLWETSFTLPPRRKPGGGNHAHGDPRRPPPSRGPAAPEAGACGYRPGLRQRSLAPSFAVSRDRTDPPAQEKSRSPGYARWLRAAPISKTLDRWNARSAG